MTLAERLFVAAAVPVVAGAAVSVACRRRRGVRRREAAGNL